MSAASISAVAAEGEALKWYRSFAALPLNTKLPSRSWAGFNPGEREYIRRELHLFFSTYPKRLARFSAENRARGLTGGAGEALGGGQDLPRTWADAAGYQRRLPRLFFTEPGLAELRAMMRDKRLADPMKFNHVRQELGIDPPPADAQDQQCVGRRKWRW